MASFWRFWELLGIVTGVISYSRVQTHDLYPTPLRLDLRWHKLLAPPFPRINIVENGFQDGVS